MVSAVAGTEEAAAASLMVSGGGGNILPRRRPMSALVEKSSVVKRVMLLVRERTAFWLDAVAVAKFASGSCVYCCISLRLSVFLVAIFAAAILYCD